MKIVTSYNVRLKTEYIPALKQTVTVYTDAVRYFMDIILQEWDNVKDLSSKSLVNCVESLTHYTEKIHIPNILILIQGFPNCHVI